MSGRGDERGSEDGVRVAVPLMRPWWRSVGFWLGLLGLGLLVWMWVDSLSMVRYARQFMSSPQLHTGYFQWEVVVQEGAVMVSVGSAYDVMPGVTFLPVGVETGYEEGPLFYIPESRWGMTSAKTTTAKYGAFPKRAAFFLMRTCWLRIGFVVAGYVVVWLGSLVMWRWWVWRRWRRSQVVEG